jgi:hypothetical protein
VLAFPEDAALPEHRVHERRFAMVDVRDDCDVPDIGTSLHGSFIRYANPTFMENSAAAQPRG